MAATSMRRKIRYCLLRLVRLRGSTKAIARGLAIGVFAGCFPILGFQILIGLLLATIFKGNRVAAVAGTWISNPFTYLPLFWFNFTVGQFILKDDSLSLEGLDLFSPTALIDSGVEIFIILMVGCTVVGTIAAVVVYFVTLRTLHRWRHHRRDRQLKRRRSPHRRYRRSIPINFDR